MGDELKNEHKKLHKELESNSWLTRIECPLSEKIRLRLLRLKNKPKVTWVFDRTEKFSDGNVYEKGDDWHDYHPRIQRTYFFGYGDGRISQLRLGPRSLKAHRTGADRIW